MSLPQVFAVEPGAVPNQTYLRAEQTRVRRWRARLEEAAPAGLRVGLVWAGNPRRGNPAAAAVDRRRSIDPERLAPLAAAAGITFFSLQTGEAAASARTPPPGLALVDLGSRIADFRDTAAILCGLDLLITVDTAAVHLAGALGRPVWLLNRFDTDWRWGREGTGSPWYPSLRLYRQARPGDWGPAIERVAADLASVRPGA
jgi:hypothetical protein